MSHGHGHSHRAGDGDPGFEVARGPRLVLVGLLVAAALATVVGVVALWPDGGRVDDLSGSVGFASAGVTFPEAVITKVQPACPQADPSAGDPSAPGAAGSDSEDGAECGSIRATVAEGADEGTKATVEVPAEVSGAGLSPGDGVELVRTPGTDGQPATFSYFGTPRSGTLWLLLVLFVVVVLLVARLRGLLALVGLAFSGAVILGFVLPALLTDEPAVAVGVVGSAAILFVVLYTTHGFSMRTSAALGGTLAGLAVTAGLGHHAVRSAHLSGVVDESGSLLTTFAGGLDFQGLMTCAIIIAGLGVLNDVTITQASAVWELRDASPAMSRTSVFTSAMRIGRDHIASTIYTIVFAYTGTALTVLLIIQLYDRPLLDLVGTEQIAEEVIRSLVSSIGLVLAVPLTTAIAALTVPGARAALDDATEDALSDAPPAP